MISTDSAVHHTPMNHELPESKNLSPDNKEHAGLMKPTVVASIFTKEGRRFTQLPFSLDF